MFAAPDEDMGASVPETSQRSVSREKGREQTVRHYYATNARLRHYYGPLYRSLAESGQWREAPPDPDHLLPESVPSTIDQTDVLLALLIGEAMLDEEGFRGVERNRSLLKREGAE